MSRDRMNLAMARLYDDVTVLGVCGAQPWVRRWVRIRQRRLVPLTVMQVLRTW